MTEKDYKELILFYLMDCDYLDGYTHAAIDYDMEIILGITPLISRPMSDNRITWSTDGEDAWRLTEIYVPHEGLEFLQRTCLEFLQRTCVVKL